MSNLRNYKFLSKARFTAGFLTLICCLWGCSSSRNASTSVPPAEGMSRELKAAGENVRTYNDNKALSIARAVAATYTPWQRLSIKGKAKVKGLPVSLSLKIYMTRTSEILMSLSAPLLGEVGRVEISQDSVLLVNKRSKTYCRESIASYLTETGATLTDIQDLLTGRVFLLGSGTLSESNASLVEVSQGPSDTWFVTPKNQPERANYGFTLYPDGQMSMATAYTPDRRYEATAMYTHLSDGTEMDLSLKFGNKPFKLEISMEEPNYSPTPLQPIAINPKWKRTGFKEWLKSF